jgi:hypothetical protein
METMQIHLQGQSFSGRGVRYRELDPFEVEENLKGAAKILGAEATPFELKKTEWRNGAKQMIVEFSEPCEDLLAVDENGKPKAKWRKMTPDVLEDFSSYFKTKDLAVLEHIYRQNHEVLQNEVEAIVGKALPVSVG